MLERVEKLLSLLDAGPEVAVLLTKRENIRYYSGYSGEGAVVLTRGGCAIVTDFRYTEQAEQEAPGFSVLMTSAERKALAVQREFIESSGCKRVLIEADGMTHAAYLRIVEAFSGLELGDPEGKPEVVRRVKDASEIETMAIAEKLVDQAFAHALGFIKPGVTELDVVAELEYSLRKLGGEGAAFSTIVCSGPNTSLPHARPCSRKIQQGDMVTMDFGTLVKGMCSDFTRTVAVGDPGPEMRRVYDTVLKAQLAALEAVKPGVTGSQVDGVARDIINAAGYEGRFGHGLGHGVGLLIHEGPRMGQTSQDALEIGNVVTVEPGIYLPGVGGVRIEDMVVVTSEGHRNLTGSPKELIIL